MAGTVYLLHGAVTGATADKTAAADPPSATARRADVAARRHIFGVDAATTSASARVGTPTHLRIGSIDVSTDLQPLGLLSDGTLEPPSRWQEAGWFAKGVVPGEVGPAVIAGHIDSTNGPAIFYHLDDLRPGDTATVTFTSGRPKTFVVDRIQRFPKKHFPTDTVYGPTPDAELRLVTCTGTFDAAAHSYLDNLVVSAHLR